MTNLNLTNPKRWAEKINAQLPAGISPHPHSSLLMMVGLPAAGKSILIHHLQQYRSFQLIRTDVIRKHIVPHPTYSDEEIDFIYQVCHHMIRQQLQQNHHVVFDATNIYKKWRTTLRTIAAQTYTPLATCYVTVAPEITHQRMQKRWSSQRHVSDQSDGDWRVYQTLAQQFQPLTQPHLKIDTSNASPDQLAKTVHEYWRGTEQQIHPLVEQ